MLVRNLVKKLQIEIESLEAIRVASKSYGIDIKTRLFELDNKLDHELMIANGRCNLLRTNR